MNISGANANKSKYYWKENFESFSQTEAEKYHFGVTQYPFNLYLYDTLMEGLLEPFVKVDKSLNVLDAGGGTGKWSLYFASLGHQVTLMDVARPMLDVAEKVVKENNFQDKVTVQQGTIVNLNYQDNSFDFVFSDRNPISHCGAKEDSYKAIREVYRVMKKDGYVIGCVLNRARKVAQIAMELKLEESLELMQTGEMKRSDEGVSHYYYLSELKSVLEDTGFKNIKIIPTTALAEFIPTAWLLDEIPVQKLLLLEENARQQEEFINMGVRFHFVAQK